MKKCFVLFFLLSVSIYAQNTIEVEFISKTPLEIDELIYKSQDSIIYYTQNESFIKLNNNKKLSYSNLQLGEISSADVFNPLKINLFYSDFNTAVILDNRLAEMYRIDFNLLNGYKNISHISTGGDNTLWAFNQDTQQLELFDYKALQTKYKTLPIASEVETLKSNYNYCWLLTESYLYCFSYFGSLICKIAADDFDDLTLIGDDCIIEKDDKLFYASKDTQVITEIKHKNIDIEQFFVTNQTLYIYDENYIYNFKIK